jgi:antitoxin CptB
MSDADNFDSHKLDARRRKIYFRSCHRGIKEMDIIFSRFARAVLAELDEAALDDYERMLELPDDMLFAWATGREQVPEELNSPLLVRLLDSAMQA